MNIYTFYREGGFYPIEIEDDATAIKQARLNKGTVKVVNEITGETVWRIEADINTLESNK